MICLYDHWEDKEQTSIHELIHALGFGHEHQRPDSDSSIAIGSEGKNDSKWSSQFKKIYDGIGITRFDPFIVMLYCERDGYLVRNEADPVWKLKPNRDELNRQLSELDKVGLNVVYKPCRHSGYNPKISPVTGLYYCGRKVMSRHSYPDENTTDGFCGPSNWANCPACRTLVTEKFREIVKDGKWQGWSGLVYCGIYFGKQEPGHDGYCGPDNGPPCSKCRHHLYPDCTQSQDDPVWKLKTTRDELIKQLSELHIRHGYCGPNNWDNCTALVTEKFQEIDFIDGKWQGCLIWFTVAWKA